MQPLNEFYLYVYCPRCSNKLGIETVNHEKVKKCRNCGFIFWNNPKPVVSLIVHKEGKVLMFQRAKEPLKGYWVLPGGFIMHEETPEQALKREVNEEAGTPPEIKKLIGVYQIDNDPRGIHLDIIYEGEIKADIKLSSEHQTFGFFAFNELPKNIAYKHRDAILDWHNKGSQYG